jgi:hypothetical protein
MFRAILIASLVVAGLTTAARAAMVGLGNQDCGTWTSNNPAAGGVGLFYQQWIFGYLSGASHADPDRDPLKGVDAPAIMQWLDDYCCSGLTTTVSTTPTFLLRTPQLHLSRRTIHLEPDQHGI